MVRWIIGLVLANLLGWAISAGLCAGGGLAVTKTTSAVSAGVDTIPVTSTLDFLSADGTSPAYVVVDNEVIKYEGKDGTHFTECTRGVTDPQNGKSSTAAAHSSGVKVRTLEVQVLDSIVGYNIVSSSESFGFLDGIWFLGRMLWNLPKLLTWDFVFLRGYLVYVRYILMAVSAGITVGLVIAIRKG